MEVCDSMMYPLPPDLQFPSSSPEGQESSDMEMEPVSLEEPLAPKAIGKLKQWYIYYIAVGNAAVGVLFVVTYFTAAFICSSFSFVRHRSFQEQSFTRQIMIPHRKKVTQVKLTHAHTYISGIVRPNSPQCKSPACACYPVLLNMRCLHVYIYMGVYTYVFVLSKNHELSTVTSQ